MKCLHQELLFPHQHSRHSYSTINSTNLPGNHTRSAPQLCGAKLQFLKLSTLLHTAILPLSFTQLPISLFLKTENFSNVSKAPTLQYNTYQLKNTYVSYATLHSINTFCTTSASMHNICFLLLKRAWWRSTPLSNMSRVPFQNNSRYVHCWARVSKL